jgi:hypothetical protein
MEKEQKLSRVPGILLIIGSVIGIIFWLVTMFFAFLLGGSPGPGYERTVPLSAAGLTCFGFAGAIVGVVAGVKALRGISKSTLIVIIVTALLGVVGSIPMFLLELPEVGVIDLMFGIFPSAICLILAHFLHRTKT